MQITEILARRTDLSTFLVHFTRSNGAVTAKQNLISILQAGSIGARSAFGMAVQRLQGAEQPVNSQHCVCFTETPLEHTNLLVEEIENRAFRFEPYGIAITRKQGRLAGVNPVWYIDITPGHNWLTVPLNNLIVQAIQAGAYDQQDLSKLTPFIEQMGSGPGNPITGAQSYRKEFWWEREWRHRGDFSLPARFIVLCPAADIADIRGVVQNLDPLVAPSRVCYVDPTWSLEMIIGYLGGFRADELGPF